MLATARLRPLAAVAALTVAGAVAAGAAAAPGRSGHAAAAQRITPSRVGKVHLRATYGSLRAAGLVHRIGRGCPLSGPGSRAARLKAPLKGSVNFTSRSPRRVTDIQVTGGAKARGVGVGARPGAIRKAFPKATFDHRTDKVFQLTLVSVPRNGGGRLQFAISTKTHRVTLIGVPVIPFCE